MRKIDEVSLTVRRAIDENWSERRRLVIGVGSCVAALAILFAGIWIMRASTPPKLPTTVDEVVRVMNSSKYRNLDNDRKQQYAEAAVRVMRDVPEEQRRELFRDEDARQAIRTAFMQQMDDLARRVARGESLEDAFADMPFGPGRGRPGGGRPGGQRPEGQRPEGDRPEGEGRDGGGRGQRMAGRMGDMVQTGNAQRTALHMELRQQMRAQREAQGDR